MCNEKKVMYNKIKNIKNSKLFSKVALSQTTTHILDVESQFQSTFDFNGSKVGFTSVKEMKVK